MAAVWHMTIHNDYPSNVCCAVVSIQSIVLKNFFWVVVENILEPVTGFIVLDTGRHYKRSSSRQ